MEILYFNIEYKGSTREVVYDPYSNLYYDKELENHFKSLRNIDHPFQKKAPITIPSSADEIIPFIGMSNNRLTLDITENCNLRCKYCVYNGKHQNRRKFSKKEMSETTLLESLKYYKEIKSGRKNKSKKKITIGFYGGEPTLLPAIIKKGVTEAFKLFGSENISIIITTNGTNSKNEDLINFLIENNVRIHISLDGPLVENDKFRIYPSGKGSFNDVIRFIDKLKDFHKMVQLTLHPHHDWEAIDNFLDQLTKEYPNTTSTINFYTFDSVDGLENKKLVELFNFKINNIQNIIIDKLEKGYSLSPLQENYVLLCSQNFNFNFLPYWGKKYFINSCFPGADRISIDPSGDIYICEKVQDIYKLGNIQKGIDPKKVMEFWEQLVQLVISLNCRDCSFHRVCFKCYALMDVREGYPMIRCNRETKALLFKMLKFLIKVNYLKEAYSNV